MDNQKIQEFQNTYDSEFYLDSYELAYQNVKQYIEDCEIDLCVDSSDHEPCDYGDFLMYSFKLKSVDIRNFNLYIEMPALPIYKLRHMKNVTFSTDFYERISIDEKYMYWWDGVITKEKVIKYLEGNLFMLDLEIKDVENLINELKNNPIKEG
jgi:hypothetical protein